MVRIALMIGVGMSLMIATPAFAQVCDPKKGPCPCDPNKEVCEPPPKGDADCSPGYYKNHPEAWCPDPSDFSASISCGGNIGTVTCQQLIDNWLDAAQGNPKAERDEAKACLDNMFGSSELSPCTDD